MCWQEHHLETVQLYLGEISEQNITQSLNYSWLQQYIYSYYIAVVHFADCPSPYLHFTCMFSLLYLALQSQYDWQMWIIYKTFYNTDIIMIPLWEMGVSDLRRSDVMFDGSV